MKKLFLVLFIPFLCANCSDDDDNTDTVTEVSKTYTLAAVEDSGVSGTAKFIKVDDATTRVEVALTGTPAGGDHPMHIHENSVAETGAPVIVLTNVNGDTGMSSTTVTMMNDKAITYEELIALDAHINVHLSGDDLSVVSQGDVGSNVN